MSSFSMVAPTWENPPRRAGCSRLRAIGFGARALADPLGRSPGGLRRGAGGLADARGGRLHLGPRNFGLLDRALRVRGPADALDQLLAAFGELLVAPLNRSRHTGE